jgi:hypothetical protein
MTESKMDVDFVLVLLMILTIFFLYFNSCNYSYFGSGPSIFLEEGYGEGTYYDNMRLEPIYREIKLKTIYDKDEKDEK